jgi:peptide/nickel transport system substrate-binding protein
VTRNRLPWFRDGSTGFLQLVAVFLLFLSAGCGIDPDSGSRPQRFGEAPVGALAEDIEGEFGQSLSYALSVEPATYNLLAASEARSKLLGHLISATVLEFDPLTQTVGCGVCDELQVDPGGRSIEIGLREGLRFSDGAPVSSQDIAFVFDRVYQSQSANVLKDTLMVGGEPIRVEVLDDRRVRFLFEEVCAACPFLLATVPVLPAHRLADSTEPIENLWTMETPVEQVVGLGPFAPAEHLPGVRTVLRANPYYWRVDSSGHQLPYLDEIHLLYLPDRNSQLLRLETGELDLVDQVLRPEDWEVLRRSGRVDVLDAGPSTNLSFFWFNLGTAADGTRGEWFRTSQFRRAISWVVDRKAIVESAYKGYASPAFSMVTASHLKWFLGPEALLPPESPLREAETLLREAGFRVRETAGRRRLLDSRGRPVQFELLTRSDETLGRTAAIVQQDLAQLGIEILIRQEEFRAVIARVMQSRDYDAALLNIEIPLEPSDMANLLRSDGAMHVWNPAQSAPETDWEREIDELVDQLGRVVDPEERYQLFSRVQRLLAAEMPLIPLVNRDVVVAKAKPLENVAVANCFPYSLARPWGIWRSGGGAAD